MESGKKVDFKVVLLGMSNVGKTCVFQRFLYDRFNDHDAAPTIGAAYGEKHVTCEGKDVTISLWDTAGSERYESMTRMYYKGASVALVCYDLTNGQSLKKVKMWCEEVQKYVPECVIIFVGTKLDLIESGSCARAVDAENIKSFAASLNVPPELLFETSAQSGKGVTELFQTVAKYYVPKNADGSIVLTEGGSSGGGGGCQC